MSALPNYKEIIELVKKGATLEAQEKIMEYRETILALQEENISLKQKLKDLEEKLNTSVKLVFKDSLYYTENDSIPFCPHCWERDKLAIHLKGPDAVEGYKVWDCPKCKENFPIGKKPPSVSTIKLSR